MKTRTGFVSNSSSSSFIIALPRKPQSREETQDLLFFKSTKLYTPSYGDTKWPVETVAGRVFNDLRKKRPLTKKKMVEVMCAGWFKTMFDFEHFEEGEGKDRHVNWDRWHEYQKTEAEMIVNDFIKAHKGMKFFVLSYSDGDGSFDSSLEHGPLFERVPHITVSHH